MLSTWCSSVVATSWSCSCPGYCSKSVLRLMGSAGYLLQTHEIKSLKQFKRFKNDWRRRFESWIFHLEMKNRTERVSCCRSRYAAVLEIDRGSRRKLRLEEPYGRIRIAMAAGIAAANCDDDGRSGRRWQDRWRLRIEFPEAAQGTGPLNKTRNELVNNYAKFKHTIL